VSTLIAQLSDPHIRIGPGDVARVEALATAVARVAAVEPAPDAVLLTGDLADTPSDAEYERVRELVAPLPMPVHVLAGNHDDRDMVCAHFGLPAPQYAVDAGELRIVVADTVLAQRGDGAFSEDELAWLEAELAATTRPTLLALHHVPFLTGVVEMDSYALAAESRAALRDIVARHPHVKAIVGGHIHRTAVSGLGGCPVFACPSTYLQLELDLTGKPIDFSTVDPPGFALHLLLDGELTTHVVPIVGS